MVRLLILILMMTISGCATKKSLQPRLLSNAESKQVNIILDKLYDSFSYKENQEPNWDLMRSVFVEIAAYDFYQKNYLEIRKSWGVEADQYVPILLDSKEIWSLLSNPKILILSEYADLSIYYDTSWDLEHGLTLLFKNGEILNIE